MSSFVFFFSSRRRHTRSYGDWSSDVCSSDLVTVEGSDPLACYAAAREAHDRARRGDGPTLIEAKVVRLTSHSSDDDQRRYRDPAEVEALKERDPLPAFANQLREAGLLDVELDGRLRAEV